MDLNLKEKVIIITGAAKGIGRSIAEVFAKENAVAVVVGRKANDNQIVVDAIIENGGKAAQFVAELSNPDDCKKVIEEIVSQFGRIDGLVNNAGVNDGVGLESGNYEDFMASLHKNVVHYYLMAHHALPELIKSK
ncbi:MAG: SDR family NAD(P)-dependent oxidoreductase, partial [Sphingobacteriales bacterium]